MPRRFSALPVADGEPLEVAAATRDAVVALLRMQQGEGDAEWPYQGVYREDHNPSPLGYRVGGTAIVCLGLIAAPGFRTDEARQSAVARGLDFVLEALGRDRMQIGFIGNYDVRGWGHIYALQLLLQLVDHGLAPAAREAEIRAKTGWLVQALVDAAIPAGGGWNYSRPSGYRSPNNSASTFMTAPALQVLFHAAARGHPVPEQVVGEALAALERARSKPGGYAYGAGAAALGDVDEPRLPRMDKTPGAAARAAVCEATLLLAGRGDQARLSRAVALFFAHWDDLAVRKSQTGTHVGPYGIAPYYFMFGHVYAAQAIELLADPEERAQRRLELRKVLWRSRDDDGAWNDRIAACSAGYGTALALLALHMPDLPPPVPWSVAAAGAGR